MPTAVIISYSKKSGKTIAEVEKCWKKAEEKADKVYNNKGHEYWAYVNIRTQMCLGISEKKKKKTKK